MSKPVSRTDLLKSVKKVVIKVGSGVITGKHGLNIDIIDGLAEDICSLREDGIEVIMVSSGAIASGLKKLGFTKRPQSVSEQQAMAAIGQSGLMMAYEKAFGLYDSKVAQVLITRDDLAHRRRYLNTRNTLRTLLSWKIIPVINENDTVVVDEIKFGDNDNLSAMVTNLTESHLLINLTNIDGLFDKDPRVNKHAMLIKVVDKVDRRIMKYAGSIPGFLGTGGMASKIKAARKVALGGVPTIIANGLKPRILKQIFMGKEEGTLFYAGAASLCSRKQWIAFTKSPNGEIVVDRGAEAALLHNGKSLLPSGITEVKGRFSLGDSVLLINSAGEKLAIGLVNYHSGDIKKIIGVKTHEIESRLGFKHDDEVIHRDNLVLTEQIEIGGDVCHSQTQ